MEIYLSKGMRKNCIFCAFYDLFCAAVFVYWLFHFGFDWLVLLVLLCLLFFISCGKICLYPYRILMTRIRVTQNTVSSFLWKKKLCQVDLTGKVYYGVFSFRSRVVDGEEKYILISNSEIQLKKPGFMGDAILLRVDKEKQILIPYHSRAQYFPNSRDWIYQHIE